MDRTSWAGLFSLVTQCSYNTPLCYLVNLSYQEQTSGVIAQPNDTKLASMDFNHQPNKLFLHVCCWNLVATMGKPTTKIQKRKEIVHTWCMRETP